MSIFKRLRRALSREFGNEDDKAATPPKCAPVLPKWFDRESRCRAARAQRANLNKPPLPLEGIEGRDKWLREVYRPNP